MVHAEGTFLWWGVFISSFRAIAYIIDKQIGTCRRCFLLPGLCVQSVKITTYVSNRFNTSFCTKDHKTHQSIPCYKLLHQASNGEGKNSLRKRRGILASDRDLQRVFFFYTTLILIYNVLSSFRLYYILFKEVKIFGRPGAGGWEMRNEGQGSDMRAGAWEADNPNLLLKALSTKRKRRRCLWLLLFVHIFCISITGVKHVYNEYDFIVCSWKFSWSSSKLSKT